MSCSFRTKIFALLVGLTPPVAMAAEPPTRPGQVKLTDERAMEAAHPGTEISTALARFGVDYPVLLQVARSGDSRALEIFLALGHSADLDGAAAEGYAYDHAELITKLGDAKFARAIASLSRGALEACYQNLCFEVTQDDPGSKAAADQIRAKFPKTLEAIELHARSKPLWK